LKSILNRLPLTVILLDTTAKKIFYRLLMPAGIKFHIMYFLGNCIIFVKYFFKKI